MAQIRILMVSEHALFRQAVKVAFERAGDLSVDADTTPSAAALDGERSYPDVAIIDVGTADREAFETVAAFHEALPECGVLVLVDGQDLPSLMTALEAGAIGYMAKTAPLEQLIAATRSVAEGRTVIPGSMLGGLIGSLLQRRRDADGALLVIYRLTRREREVLVLLSEGANNYDIAERLVISPQTARTHVQNILRKLGVHSRLEAAALARRSGVAEELVLDGERTASHRLLALSGGR